MPDPYLHALYVVWFPTRLPGNQGTRSPRNRAFHSIKSRGNQLFDNSRESIVPEERKRRVVSNSPIFSFSTSSSKLSFLAPSADENRTFGCKLLGSEFSKEGCVTVRATRAERRVVEVFPIVYEKYPWIRPTHRVANFNRVNIIRNTAAKSHASIQFRKLGLLFSSIDEERFKRASSLSFREWRKFVKKDSWELLLR